MVRSYVPSWNQKNWDEGIPSLIFPAWESIKKTLAHLNWILIMWFGYHWRCWKKVGYLWMKTLMSLVYVTTFKTQLMEAGELAKKNLYWGQACMKVWHDQKVIEWTIDVGDKVLMILLFARNPLQAKCHGP